MFAFLHCQSERPGAIARLGGTIRSDAKSLGTFVHRRNRAEAYSRDRPRASHHLRSRLTRGAADFALAAKVALNASSDCADVSIRQFGSPSRRLS